MNTQLALAALFASTTLTLSPSDSVPSMGTGGQRRNLPPVCVIQEVGTIACQGDITVVQLDGGASYDPEGQPLTYAWASCPNSTLDDPTSPTPILTIDTSGSCDQICGVRFEVSDGKGTAYCRVFVGVETQTGPHLDIKPGSCPNPINVSNYAEAWEAKVAVSLLGNDFDVTQANVSTLSLRRVAFGDLMFGGGVAIYPVQDNMGDTGTPYTGGGACGCHALGGDGVTDLDLKFFKIDIIEAFELTAEDNNTYVELELVGELLDGTPFTARDCIRILNNG